jgi:broad specificity phosphatase PhoE
MVAVPRLQPVPFWFLRHGETDWNAQGLSQGHTDIPLNAVGLAQARRAARTLEGSGIATVVSSPLGRARVTAEIVAEALGLPVAAFDDDLREVNFGVQEGEPMGDWYDDWIAGTYTPERAEPFSVLLARAVLAVNRAGARGGARRAVPRAAPGLRPGAQRPHAQRPADPMRTACGRRERLDPHAGEARAGMTKGAAR